MSTVSATPTAPVAPAPAPAPVPRPSDLLARGLATPGVRAGHMGYLARDFNSQWVGCALALILVGAVGDPAAAHDQFYGVGEDFGPTRIARLVAAQNGCDLRGPAPATLPPYEGCTCPYCGDPTFAALIEDLYENQGYSAADLVTLLRDAGF